MVCYETFQELKKVAAEHNRILTHLVEVMEQRKTKVEEENPKVIT